MPHSHAKPSSRSALEMRLSTWSAMVPVVALLAGGLFATSSTAAAGGSLRNDSDSIADLILRGNERNERDAAELDTLQAEVDALARKGAEGNAEVASLKAKADELAVQAGRTAVTGDAVEVTLNDSKLKSHELPSGFTIDDIIVRQQDVQAVVNALWAAGAEAMMLMDQRVITTSAVRCVGNTLILQGRVYSPPYTISAIGDAQELQRGLANNKQVKVYREYVSAVGLGYQVKVRPNATFPAYSGSISPRHARVLAAS